MLVTSLALQKKKPEKCSGVSASGLLVMLGEQFQQNGVMGQLDISEVKV